MPPLFSAEALAPAAFRGRALYSPAIMTGVPAESRRTPKSRTASASWRDSSLGCCPNIQYWVYPFLGYKKVRSIQATDIQDLYAHLREQISERTGEKLSQATIQRVHVHLRMAFNWGIKTGQLSRHPMDAVQVRKPSRQKMVVFSEGEIRQFLREWDKYRTEVTLRIPYGPIFNLAYETGMRPEEYWACSGRT
jgi:hypothetical protein